MHGVGVGGRMDRDRLDAHLVTGAVDAERDLTAVCDQDLGDGHQLLVIPKPSFPRKRESTEPGRFWLDVPPSMDSRFRGNDEEGRDEATRLTPPR